MNLKKVINLKIVFKIQVVKFMIEGPTHNLNSILRVMMINGKN